jgi:hypothetical protein
MAQKVLYVIASHAGAQAEVTLQRMPSGHTIDAQGSPVHLRGVSEFLANGPQPPSVAKTKAATAIPRDVRRSMRAP